MKNFRKVLALVLVVATLFSFTAMTSAAYEDADKISYEEAVEVLSAVGILNGYEVAEDEYEFKPTQTISREEMAKMIAVLANAGDDVSTLYASANTFADVAKDRWSASYVAYCAKTGIVAGRSASTFDPTGKVTGLETAKMLLVVLGFDAEEQGYVGADWKVNVLRDAKVMGLLQGFAADYDIDVAITREEAAQMMLNALKAPCVVGILSDGIVTITNALVTNWGKLTGNTVGKLMNITAYGKLKDAMDAGEWCLYGNVVISNDKLATTLYEIKEVADRTDCYGRPAVVWVNKKGDVIASAAKTPIWSSTNTNYDKVMDVLEDADLTLDDFYKDGKPVTSGVSTEMGGKGVLVEVFSNGDVVEINTYLGYIAEINTAKDTFDIVGYNNDKYTVDNTDYGYKVKDEGTKVLYWPCGETGTGADGIHAVKTAEAEVINLHGIRASGSYFCDVNENKYEYSANHEGDKVEVWTGAVNLDSDDIYIYTDNYGYVLYLTDKTAATGIAVLVQGSGEKTFVKDTTKYGQVWNYEVDFVDFEGTNNVAVPETFTTDADTYAQDHAWGSDVLVSYTVDEDGRVAVERIDDYGSKALTDPYILKASGKLVANAGADNEKVLPYAATNDTQILLRVYNYDGTYTYKYFDGKDEVDAAYKLDKLQYKTVAKGKYLAYIYAEATYAVSSNLAFVLSYAGYEAYIDEVNINGVPMTYHLYKALVNGEEAYVAYDDELQDAIDDKAEKLMGVFEAEYVRINAESHDGLPVYMAVTTATPTAGTEFIIVSDTLTWVDGTDKFAAADMADDASIWFIEQTEKNDKVSIQYVEATYDEVVDYIEAHGWDTQHAYVGYNAAGEVNTMYVYVVAK